MRHDLILFVGRNQDAQANQDTAQQEQGGDLFPQEEPAEQRADDRLGEKGQ